MLVELYRLYVGGVEGLGVGCWTAGVVALYIHLSSMRAEMHWVCVILLGKLHDPRVRNAPGTLSPVLHTFYAVKRDACLTCMRMRFISRQVRSPCDPSCVPHVCGLLNPVLKHMPLGMQVRDATLDPQVLVDKFRSLRVKLGEATAGEPLTDLTLSLKALTGLLCSLHEGSAESGSTSIEVVLDALSDVQKQLADVVRSLTQTQKLTVTEVASVTEELAVICCRQQQLLDEYRFLAEWRDYISLFRVLLVRQLDRVFVVTSWEQLAAGLQLEEGLPEAQQPTTNATKDALAAMGVSWQEWQQLGEVSDAGIAIVHRGKSAGIAEAIARIDTMSMPAYLSHTRGTLKKAVQYVRDAGPACLVRRA